ncbi:chaperonin GroEL (HSP60 family) [Bradyrhizobium sp. USDA 10063]
MAKMMAGQGSFGFDDGRKEYVDLVETGIIDPVKVFEQFRSQAYCC